ncbi:MAG: NADH-quinone oxidoreductase subunit L, partial [Myxococcota bacterium]
EGVGLCSYLLIGFWFHKTEYANAGRKAFVVNRIGDFAFLLGVFLIFQYTGTLDFPELRTPEAMTAYRGELWGERVAFWAGLFLFIGACGKSAQIPLYVWLPDAMAGPTPVSALIHAATMVTAGVYMVARLSFLYASSTTAMAVVAAVGALTALFAAVMAFAQTDFKKVLAYSTVSQLGFMFVGVGVGAYVTGIFHLVTHAFFKAGLFLAAGSVMHAMSGSGDITKMGGLRKYMKHTHLAFVAYWLAICGIFPFAGFFSKDEVLAGAWVADGQGWIPAFGEILWVVLTLAALGTAFYMSRLYFLVFTGECRADEETKSHIHESPFAMTSVLLILAFFTTIIGFLGLPHLHILPIEGLLEHWLDASLALDDYGAQFASIEESLGQRGELTPGLIGTLMAIAVSVAAVGIFAAYKLYGKGMSNWVAARVADGPGAKLYDIVYNKFYIDEIYEAAIVRPFRWICNALWQVADRFVIDTIFVNGSAVVVGLVGRVARWWQNGQIHRYLALLLIGAAAVFFFTRQGKVDFTYEINGQGGAATVTLRADVGSGPSAIPRGSELLWDLNGDGDTDDPLEQQFAGQVEIAVPLADLGSEVSVFYTDGVFRSTVSKSKRIVSSGADGAGANDSRGNGGNR